MSTNKKKKIIIAIVLILLLIAGVIGFLVYRSGIKATTMRVLRIEGVVNLQDSGSFKAVKENLRLKSGNALDTATDSLVSIGLDEVKIVTLDQLSRAEFNQQGKYLNLELTKGSLFFEVDKPLADDETFEIETSTMIVGIRGTSGWVSVEGGIESLIITDGHVHVIGTNPVTGEVKEIDVYAGQRLRVYLYNDRKVDSIMFELEDITERELPEFVLRMLRENPALLDKVCAETGWDKPWILGLIDEEPEPEPEPEPGTSGDVTEPKPEPEPVIVTDAGDVGGNNENDTDLNPGPVNPVVTKPAPTVLETLIAEAKKHIVRENEDGTYIIDDDRLFDGVYYANRYPDVAEAFGTDRDALLAHYETIGKFENRFTSKEEEDAKILADAIARLPKEDPNANQTTTPQQTGPSWPTNTFTYTANGMSGTWDGNGHFNINTAPAQTPIILPATIDDGNGNSVNLTLNMVNNQTSNNDVDASALNPSLSQMKTFVENQRNGNGTNANSKVTNGLTTVSYGIKHNVSTPNGYQNGYIAEIASGQADSAESFVAAVQSAASSGIDAVSFGTMGAGCWASNGVQYSAANPPSAVHTFTSNNVFMVYAGTTPHENVTFTKRTSASGETYYEMSGSNTYPGGSNGLNGKYLLNDGLISSSAP